MSSQLFDAPQSQDGQRAVPVKPQTLQLGMRHDQIGQGDIEPTLYEPTEHVQRFSGLGVGLASLFTENLLSHPCIVLRRQCQVNNKALYYHLTPFTLIPVAVTLQRHQGFSTLWKGLGSTFIVKGLSLATENIISEVTPLPREIYRHSSWKQIGQHLIVKGLTFALMTPFYASSLIETVQSDIASEKPGIFDCIKEGVYRLMGWNTPHTTRLLPIWLLVFPTVLHGMFHYIIKNIVQYSVLVNVKKGYDNESRSSSSESVQTRTMKEVYYSELLSTFTGGLMADVLLYPLETVLHRLHLQGTRTIIDNLDLGSEVVPIMTRYEGLRDCYSCIIQEEGYSGLYKGFGAIVCQYMINALILKLTKMLLDHLSNEYSSRRHP